MIPVRESYVAFQHAAQTFIVMVLHLQLSFQRRLRGRDSNDVYANSVDVNMPTIQHLRDGKWIV